MEEESGTDKEVIEYQKVEAYRTAAATAKAAPALKGSVWVGGQELASIGASVEDGSGGTAILRCDDDGYPILYLTGYVYEGSGYEYTTGKYAGIYYKGTGNITIVLIGDNKITVSAENATESYGILIDSDENDATLQLVTLDFSDRNLLYSAGGAATKYSGGIKVYGSLNTSLEKLSIYDEGSNGKPLALNCSGNFTVNATGGNVSGSYGYSYGMAFLMGFKVFMEKLIPVNAFRSLEQLYLPLAVTILQTKRLQDRVMDVSLATLKSLPES